MSDRVPETRQMHLFCMARTHLHIGGWRHPDAAPKDLALYQEVARIAEEAKFDALFFTDSLGFRRTRGREAFARSDGVRLEPLTLLAALAATTSNIGLVATASTLNSPYTLARQFLSIDHLSGGRAGWNVVTSSTDHEAHNFGLDKIYPHDERYVRATEYVEIVEALWDAMEEGAVVHDKATGQMFDPDRIHGLKRKGQFYNVAGPLDMDRSPQGRPIVVQAGASGPGKAFSARFADCVFTVAASIDDAKAFYREMKAQVAAGGRDPAHYKILPAIHPVIGSTEEEAQRLMEELDTFINVEDAVRALEFWIGGTDLSSFDLDAPFPDLPQTERLQSIQDRVIEWARRDNLTLRQVATKVAGRGNTGFHMVGTPEQVADVLEKWFVEEAADGFVVGAPFFPGQFDVFAKQVVPILQHRGVFRQEYAGGTLRETLGLPEPANAFATGAAQQIEPEIW